VYEYNAVVGLIKLELAIYLHGDLKEKADFSQTLYQFVPTELRIKEITISLFSGSPSVSPAYPVGQPELRVGK
jgi:hypothetical protein